MGCPSGQHSDVSGQEGCALCDGECSAFGLKPGYATAVESDSLDDMRQATRAAVKDGEETLFRNLAMIFVAALSVLLSLTVAGRAGAAKLVPVGLLRRIRAVDNFMRFHVPSVFPSPQILRTTVPGGIVSLVVAAFVSTASLCLLQQYSDANQLLDFSSTYADVAVSNRSMLLQARFYGLDDHCGEAMIKSSLPHAEVSRSLEVDACLVELSFPPNTTLTQDSISVRFDGPLVFATSVSGQVLFGSVLPSHIMDAYRKPNATSKVWQVGHTFFRNSSVMRGSNSVLHVKVFAATYTDESTGYTDAGLTASRALPRGLVPGTYQDLARFDAVNRGRAREPLGNKTSGVGLTFDLQMQQQTVAISLSQRYSGSDMFTQLVTLASTIFMVFQFLLWVYERCTRSGELLPDETADKYHAARQRGAVSESHAIEMVDLDFEKDNVQSATLLSQFVEQKVQQDARAAQQDARAAQQDVRIAQQDAQLAELRAQLASVMALKDQDLWTLPDAPKPKLASVAAPELPPS